MSPLLETLANGSAFGYRSLSAATATSFESIATATGTGSAGTITFTSIPSTYQHLQVRILVRDTSTGGGDLNLRMQFNSDTGSNYVDHNLRGDGSTVVAGGFAGNDRAVVRNFIPDSSSSNTTMYGAAIVDIHDYASTSKYKTIRTLAGKDRNGSGLLIMGSNLWMSTSAITSITFTPDGTAYATGSTFALYGVKGA